VRDPRRRQWLTPIPDLFEVVFAAGPEYNLALDMDGRTPEEVAENFETFLQSQPTHLLSYKKNGEPMWARFDSASVLVSGYLIRKRRGPE
jgi:hypothetical protein